MKGSYDTLAENIKDNNTWLCPYCTGACYCTRCMRNEKILQLIAYYLSIDGNINYLYDELIGMNSIIDELFSNFILGNIYIIMYDKNLTPIQMMDKFKNFDISKKDEIESKEDEISNLENYIHQLNKRKEAIHKEFISFCKDKYEIKNKYYIFSNRNRNDVNNEIDMNNNELTIKEDKKYEKIYKNKKNRKKNNSKINNNRILNNIVNTRSKINNDYRIENKRNKVIYFESNNYKNSKILKKVFRKKKTIINGKSRKYYIDYK